MSAGGKVPVLECVRAAYTFLGARWREALTPALFVAGAGAVAALAAPAAGVAAAALALAMYLAATISYSAAMLRVALGIDTSLRMRFGEDEGRLLMVSAATVAILVFVGFAGAIALAVVLASMAGFAGVDPAALEDDPEAAMRALGGWGEAAQFGGIGLIMAVVIFIGIRLMLAGPATIAGGRFLMFATWPWTKGSAWRMLAAVVLVEIPVLLVLLFAQRQIVQLAGGSEALTAGVISMGVGAFAGAVIAITLRQGLVAYLYSGLRPADADAAGAVT